jgi:KipI family sensor histidine kinase inhibitor
MPAPRVLPLGDSAITIQLGAEKSPALLQEVHAAATRVRAANLDYVHDVVPAYLAVTIFYDGLKRSYSEASKEIVGILASESPVSRGETVREHVIPVRYDGVDLEFVASAAGVSVDQVIQIHTDRVYSVDLLGFVPGWAYLSELDPRLQIPRRQQPRPRVAAGSVAIAATQTGIYPLDTPGGWHILGRTDTVMFDAARNPPSLLKAGDTVRFEPVT